MRLVLTQGRLKEQLGSFVNQIQAGDVYLFYGEMGAGKTTIIREIVSALGYDQAHSPTFALVNTYPTSPSVFHLDLYRLTTPHALFSLDIDRYLDDSSAVTFIEWPERLEHLIPVHAKRVVLEVVSSTERVMTVTS